MSWGSSTLGPAGDVEYSLGVGRFPTTHGQAIGHDGALPGFQAQLLHLPDANLTVAAAVNIGGSDDHRFLGSLVDEVLWLLLGPPD